MTWQKLYWLGTIACLPLVVSCGTSPVKTAYTPNPRVMQRDLLVAPMAKVNRQPNLSGEHTVAPVSDAVGAPTAQQDQVLKQLVASESSRLPSRTTAPLPLVSDRVVFVEFPNESVALAKEQLPLEDIKRHATLATHYFVVGQSHGASAVGTRRLATQRAERVAAELRRVIDDPKRVHTVALWGGSQVPFAPARGVNIVMVDETSPQWSALSMMASSATLTRSDFQVVAGTASSMISEHRL